MAEKEAWRGCQPRPPAALDEAAAPSADAGAAGGATPPQPSALTPAAMLVVSLGPEASVANPGTILDPSLSLDCLPSPGASQHFGPIFLLGSPLLPPHLSFLSHPTQKSQFLRWLVGGGMLGRGASSCFPHIRHLNLPFAWRSPGVMVTHTHTPPLQRCDRLLRADGRGGPGGKVWGLRKAQGSERTRKAASPEPEVPGGREQKRWVGDEQVAGAGRALCRWEPSSWPSE